MLPYTLVPGKNVIKRGALYDALDQDSFLSVNIDPPVPVGHWIAFSYHTSFFDPLLRPVVRFVMASAHQDAPMNAAPFGAAQWIGRIPEGTQQILVSPTNRPGLFGFSLQGLGRLGRLSLVTKALLRRPRDGLTAAAFRVFGNRSVAHHFLAAGAEPQRLADYHSWRSRRERPLDLVGLDTPRHDWNAGVHLRFLCSDSPDGRAAADLADRLSNQPYGNWSIAQVGGTTRDHKSDRIAAFPEKVAATQLLEGLPGRVILVPLAEGAIPAAYAPAVLAEHAAREAGMLLGYADEDEIDGHGRWHRPKFKPDWSPLFQSSARYIGNAIFVRGEALANAPGLSVGEVASPQRLADLFARETTASVSHLRRILLSMPRSPATSPRPASTIRSDASNVRHPDGRPVASIVIPTKNRTNLLSVCLEGVKRTVPSEIEIIVVDNGSTDADTFELYREMASDPRFTLLDAPVPFNFAKICNQGARHAKAPILVFLNNDIELPSNDWLSPLLEVAALPSVGAVGPKLVYPSGRVQHGGVVIGLGRNAGHIDSGARGDDPGYLDKLVRSHEVSGVTGACLVVEKEKFDAVGGFDEASFPVELNDIDLCLRLAKRGWRSMLVVSRTLVHHESATRGRRPPSTYRNEHEAFEGRWSDVIRDDPFHHPALSLRSIETALG